MSEKVVKFRTSQNPDDVLEQAIGVYSHVVVIGWAKDDGFFTEYWHLECWDAMLRNNFFNIYVNDLAEFHNS